MNDFREKELEEAPVSDVSRFAIENNHVYLISHNYKDWTHKTLLKVVIVDPKTE